LVLEWVSKADADFATAEREMAVRSARNLDAVCFHAQQCVEKLMKAVLTDRGTVPPITHNLIVLHELLLRHDPGWRAELGELRVLSLGAVHFRYPGMAASEPDAQEALRVASSLKQRLEDALRRSASEYHPLPGGQPPPEPTSDIPPMSQTTTSSPSAHPSTHWTAERVRKTFLDFYAAKHAHTFVPSSPVVPHDDPTLLFANAGMNQFKPIFLGNVPPGSSLAALKRAVNSQKCIRAGGKHNDLDDVGKDTYHHTFFEMLGTWSFGDYFKKESIAWGVELLTKVFGIPPERLYATYFKGDPAAGLEPDLEAKAIWEQFLPADHVLPGNMKDNFWEMGDTGPCGPCSEIHFDRIGGRNAASLVNTGDPDVLEVWNHVFIQYNREDAKTLRTLPAKHIDTGMGFERLVSVLQNKRSNYDTDVFFPIFAAIERLTGDQFRYMGRLGEHDHGNVDTAFRVIADHIRTLTFAITDGAVPSNEGRGYVLRRILRRAVRYGRQMLNLQGGFFTKLVPVVVESFGGAFPELKKDPARVEKIIREEEESFGRTLDRGIRLFEDAAARATQARQGGGGAKDSAQVSADDAFKLYDTFGFPIDLTQLMAEERGMKVDMAGYNRMMEEQKERARAAQKFAAGADGALRLGPDEIAALQKLGVKPTEDVDKFHGRDIRASVKAIFNGENFDQARRPGAAGARGMVGVILDRTNFYSEMGGQVGDMGRILITHEAAGSSDRGGVGGEGGEFKVENTMSFGGYVLHIGHVARGEIRVNDAALLALDPHRRHAVASNHTATHLLNLALRDTLGEGADQKGSLVAPDKLRFDFSFNRPVTPEELAKAESIVRERIAQNLQVYAELAPQYVARNINGLRAVFGEAYPDPVRVVSIGAPVPQLLDVPSSKDWHTYSIEFCGGTHVGATGDIGDFVLAFEEGIAKGVRRVVAMTGVPAKAAIAAANELERRVRAAEALSDSAIAEEAAAIAAQVDELTLPAARKQVIRTALATLNDRLKTLQKAAAAGRASEAAAAARQIGEAAAASLLDVVVNTIECGSDRKALQAAVNTVQQLCPRSAIMLLSPDESEGKIAIMAVVPPAMVKRGVSAGEWVKTTSEILGGKGGGKPDNASGGGTDLSKMREAISAASAWANKKLF
jgi:alanyl-tRNA synthetase